MGAERSSSAWSEVERVAEEYVDRGLLDQDVERRVSELLEDDEPRIALEVALEQYRTRRNGTEQPDG